MQNVRKDDVIIIQVIFRLIQMKKQGQLTNEIKKLQYQISYSEHINKQLSAQLATLCNKMGIAPTKFKQTSDIALINTSTHLQQLFYVEPLLMCYEQTIHLLKSELDEAKEQARAINQNVENIVSENSFLRKELQAKIQLVTKADNLGLNVNFLNLENRDLKDKIGILNSKNQYLLRKNKELDEESQKMKNQNRSLFDRQDLIKVQTKAKEESKLKQTELINYKKQIDILKNKLENETSIVSDYQNKVVNLENQVVKLKNELKVTKQQLQNNQVVQQRLKDNLEDELLSVKNQLSISMKKEQDMFTKNMALESQLQDKNNKIHNVNVQNSQLQANNNNMLQMLESYEVKVSGQTKKIKKLEADLKQMNEDKAESIKRAEISEWKLTQKNEVIERRENEWKKQKARLNKMWEDRLEAIKKSYQIPISNKI